MFFANRYDVARALALATKKKQSSSRVQRINRQGRNRRAPRLLYIALAHIALGETDEAFANLERALAEKDKWLGWINVDPRLDALRRAARFEDFLRRTNLK